MKLALPVNVDQHLPAGAPRFVRVCLKVFPWTLWLKILLVIPVGIVLLVIVLTV